MAKVNVNITEMQEGTVNEVEYNGNTFIRSDEQAEVGDITLNKTDFPCTQTEGEFYVVAKVDRYARVFDDNDDLEGWAHRAQGDKFDVFKKVKRGEVGDFLVFDDTDGVALTVGNRYEIKRLDIDGDFVITKDNGISHFVKREGSRFSYKIVKAEDAPKPTGDSDLKVGSKIKITKPTMTAGFYEKGDVLTVKFVGDAPSGRQRYVKTNETGNFDILETEFEMTDEDGRNKTIKEGDIVYFNDPYWFETKGFGVILREFGGSEVKVLGTDHKGKNVSYYHRKSDLTLVAKAANREDK